MSTGPGDDEEPRPAGHVRSTGAGAITGAALVGLVLGWSLRPVSVQLNGTAPTVGDTSTFSARLVRANRAALSY